jgi:hypothetical protein
MRRLFFYATALICVVSGIGGCSSAGKSHRGCAQLSIQFLPDEYTTVARGAIRVVGRVVNTSTLPVLISNADQWVTDNPDAMYVQQDPVFAFESREITLRPGEAWSSIFDLVATDLANGTVSVRLGFETGGAVFWSTPIQFQIKPTRRRSNDDEGLF